MNFSLLMFDTALAPVFADAASASSGADGLAFAAGGTALGAVATLVGSWLKARYTRTTIAQDPLRVEQSQFQAHCKDNARELTDIFTRLRKVEAELAGQGQAILALKDMQNRIYDMVSSLYKKICGGCK